MLNLRSRFGSTAWKQVLKLLKISCWQVSNRMIYLRSRVTRSLENNSINFPYLANAICFWAMSRVLNGWKFFLKSCWQVTYHLIYLRSRFGSINLQDQLSKFFEIKSWQVSNWMIQFKWASALALWKLHSSIVINGLT